MEQNRCGFQIIEHRSLELPMGYIFIGSISMFRCVRGSATVDRDGSLLTFAAGSHISLYESSMYRICEATEDFEYIECRMDLDFATELYPYIDNSGWSVFENNNSLIEGTSEGDILGLYFQQLCNIYADKQMQYSRQIALHTAVSYILSLYNRLLKCGTLTQESTTPISVNYSSVVDHFYYLCSTHHTSEHNIDFYAKRLNISKRHLYNIIQNSTDLTPKQILDGFVIATIKKLLLTTSLTIQQIAEQLNFPDQSTLRQFFHRKMGVSPSEYRGGIKFEK
ncbi:MAG: helix-turn-helix domain-containing protein [Rikenellaceae bacterium]